MKLRQSISILIFCFTLNAAQAQMFVAGSPAPIAGQYPWYDQGSPLFRISTQSPHIHFVSIPGTVIALGISSYVIKTDAGKIYTTHFNTTTQIVKRTADKLDARHPSTTPEQPLKSSAVKIGDYIVASGINTHNSIRANRIMQLDPSGIKLVRELRATYGRTWLMGSIIALHRDSAKIAGVLDFKPQTLDVDRPTKWKTGYEPTTLDNLQKGDFIRADGTVTNGKFIATKIDVLETPPAK